MKSLGQVMDENKGIGPGFDSLRLTLSAAILCWHSVVVCYGHETEIIVWRSPFGTALSGLLPVFFALSGFLVIGSAARNPDLNRFIALRALRIVPALATEICVSAIILGGVLTTLPFDQYVTDPVFLSYFGSLIGRISTQLPGVFQTNPVHTVNLSLWTIAPELLCYVYMSFVLLLRIPASKHWIALVTLGIVALSLIADVRAAPLEDGILSTRMLVVSFCLGNLVYLWRYDIPFGPLPIVLSLVVGLAGLHTLGAAYISLLCLSYFIACVGFYPIPRVGFLNRGDYSYGIYLYAFPIQQMVSYLLPGLRHWYLNIALSLPITVAIAVVSWHVVEKPALTLRSRIRPSTLATPRSVGRTLALCIALCLYAIYLLARANIAYTKAYGLDRLGILELAAALGVVLAALLMITDRAKSRRSQVSGRSPIDSQISPPAGENSTANAEGERHVEIVRGYKRNSGPAGAGSMSAIEE